MANDKPATPNLTFGALNAVENPEQFVYTTKASKRVVFPDVYAMEFEEAEHFLNDLAGRHNSAVLQKWLSDKDYAAVKDDKLNLRQLMTLIESVQAYYEKSWGTPGEDDASES